MSNDEQDDELDFGLPGNYRKNRRTLVITVLWSRRVTTRASILVMLSVPTSILYCTLGNRLWTQFTIVCLLLCFVHIGIEDLMKD